MDDSGSKRFQHGGNESDIKSTLTDWVRLLSRLHVNKTNGQEVIWKVPPPDWPKDKFDWKNPTSSPKDDVATLRKKFDYLYKKVPDEKYSAIQKAAFEAFCENSTDSAICCNQFIKFIDQVNAMETFIENYNGPKNALLEMAITLLLGSLDSLRTKVFSLSENNKSVPLPFSNKRNSESSNKNPEKEANMGLKSEDKTPKGSRKQVLSPNPASIPISQKPILPLPTSNFSCFSENLAPNSVNYQQQNSVTEYSLNNLYLFKNLQEPVSAFNHYDRTITSRQKVKPAALINNSYPENCSPERSNLFMSTAKDDWSNQSNIFSIGLDYKKLASKDVQMDLNDIKAYTETHLVDKCNSTNLINCKPIFHDQLDFLDFNDTVDYNNTMDCNDTRDCDITQNSREDIFAPMNIQDTYVSEEESFDPSHLINFKDAHSETELSDSFPVQNT